MVLKGLKGLSHKKLFFDMLFPLKSYAKKSNSLSMFRNWDIESPKLLILLFLVSISFCLIFCLIFFFFPTVSTIIRYTVYIPYNSMYTFPNVYCKWLFCINFQGESVYIYITYQKRKKIFQWENLFNSRNTNQHCRAVWYEPNIYDIYIIHIIFQKSK